MARGLASFARGEPAGAASTYLARGLRDQARRAGPGAACRRPPKGVACGARDSPRKFGRDWAREPDREGTPKIEKCSKLHSQVSARSTNDRNKVSSAADGLLESLSLKESLVPVRNDRRLDASEDDESVSLAVNRGSGG